MLDFLKPKFQFFLISIQPLNQRLLHLFRVLLPRVVSLFPELLLRNTERRRCWIPHVLPHGHAPYVLLVHVPFVEQALHERVLVGRVDYGGRHAGRDAWERWLADAALVDGALRDDRWDSRGLLLDDDSRVFLRHHYFQVFRVVHRKYLHEVHRIALRPAVLPTVQVPHMRIHALKQQPLPRHPLPATLQVTIKIHPATAILPDISHHNCRPRQNTYRKSTATP